VFLTKSTAFLRASNNETDRVTLSCAPAVKHI